ncbi:MAG TPA: efflux RND transporter periplasmic adaptor subunit [Beijerinckiaceae bacterium]
MAIRRILIIGGVVAGLGAAAGGLYAWRGAGRAAEAPYRLASVERGPITASVRATGTLNPVTTVLVGSQLSGQVIEVLADYNSPVKAGQVMARLYSEQIRSRRDAARADLAQAQADLAQRRAQVERTRASRIKAEAGLKDMQAQRERVAALLADARRTLERQTELTARAVGSQTSLDTARTQTEVQQATLASSEAQIASIRAELNGLSADIALAEAQVQSAEAVILQRQAKLRDVEIDLERTEIRSPVEGVVVKRDIDLGQTVAASLSAPTLFTVAQDLREIDIWANIDEADVGRLKEGQPVSFTVNAYPNRNFSGFVRMVRLGAQTVQNVVTYTAVIGVKNPDQALLPGMTANLSIVTDERALALRVANAALRFRPPGAPAAVTGPAPAVAAGIDMSALPRGGGGSRAMEALRERLVAEVQPTPEQMQAIASAIAEARAAAPGRDPSLTEEERRAAFRRMRQDMQAKIAAVLDPERRAKFAAMIEERRRPDEGTPGRVFVIDENGQPKAVPVRLGVSDGSTTEVLGGLKEGDAVITGGGPRPVAVPPETGPGQRPRGPRPF